MSQRRLGRFGRMLGRDADGIVPHSAATARALVVLVAILSFFAVMAVALGLATHRLALAWDRDLAGTATLQVLADEDEVEAQARAALDVLRATPGVQSVRMIGLDEQRDLLEPWLGSQAVAEDLPLPLLIEVSTDVGALDLPALRTRLADEAPGAVYDDHGSWRVPLVDSARRVRLFAGASLGLIALALLVVFGLAAHAAASANGGVIETLRLVGARDGYIARAFTRPLVLQALAGACIGAAAAMGLLAFVPPNSEPGFFLAGIGPVGRDWLLPLLVPPSAALLAWLGARPIVRRGLRRWS